MKNDTRSQLLQKVKQGDRVVDAAMELQIAPSTAFKWAREAGLVDGETTKRQIIIEGPFVPPRPKGEPTSADYRRIGNHIANMIRQGATGHVFTGDDWWIIEAIPGMVNRLLDLERRGT
jgi:hypothetical protein